MKTAIVTGATGFIGRALTKELIQKNVTVYALARNPSLVEKDAIPIQFDFDGPTDLENAIQENVDVFYHCAFVGGFDSAAIKDYNLQLRNAKISCDAVSLAAKTHAQKFVLASTVNVEELLTFQGSTAFKPRYTCIYGAGKLAAELMGKTIAGNSGLDFCVANIAMPYGEGNYARTLPNIVMEQLIRGISPRLIEGNNLYDLVYIQDVARALFAIGESGKNFEDYYVGHTELTTFRELMTNMRNVLSPETDLLFGEYPDTPSVDYGRIDLTKLYRDTGFLCESDFALTVSSTAKWLSKSVNVENSCKNSGRGGNF